LRRTIPLAALRPGEKAVVAALPADARRLARLLAFGILPGTALEVLQTFPVFVLSFGHTKLAIDSEIAGQIMINRSRAGR
jgi:Fe2+ transport system protein FeoA